jgi:hypothetical protein
MGDLLNNRPLIGQRAMRERVHQQLGAREAMTQCGFQSGKNGFHMRLDPMASLNSF